MFAKFKRLAPVLGLIAGILAPVVAFGQATLLPNAIQQYFDANGVPLSSGKVFYYVPNTTTPKNTWRDAGKTQLNTNPILLDAAGRPDSNGAGTYGDGIYRQVLKNANDLTIWDSLTASTGAGTTGTGGLGFGITVGTVLPWAGIALPAANYKYADGAAISRTTYPIYFTAVTQTYNTTCSSGSPTLSGLSETLRVPIGAAVEGACIAPGTTVLSKTSTSLTLSNNATASISATIRVFPWGNGDGSTTINLPNFMGRTLFGRNNMDGAAGTTNITSTYYGANPNALGAKTANPAAQSHALTQAELPNVNFVTTVTTTTNDVVRATTGFVTVPSSAGPYSAIDGTARQTITSSGTAASGGSATAFSVINPGITVDYVVKVAPDSDAGACPLPTTTTAGCILVDSAPANQFATGVSATGHLVYSALPSMAATTMIMNPTGGIQGQQALTIQGLTAITPHANNDFLPIYNAAGGIIGKVTPGQIASVGVAGVASINGLTGALGVASGVNTSGTNIIFDATTGTYLPGGTGAVAQTIQAALRRYVTAADFGAICDGNIANQAVDTAALNALTAYLNTTPYYGGIVVGTSGEHCRMNASLKVYSNMSLRGHSKNTQITFSQNGFLIEPFNSVNTLTNGTKLEDLIINGGGGAATLGIYMRNASSWVLNNVNINTVQNGIEISNQGVIPYDASNYNRFYNVVASNVTNIAYNLIGESNSNTFYSCRGNTVGFGLIDNGNNNATYNCQWEGVTGDAIRLTATSIAFKSDSDRFENGSGTPVGIRVFAGAADAVIVNPYFSGTFSGSEFVDGSTTLTVLGSPYGLKVRGGTMTQRDYSLQKGLSFGTVGAQSTSDILVSDAPLNNCTSSDEVVVNATSALEQRIVISGLSVTGGVYVRAANLSGAGTPMATQNFRITCRKRS